MASIVFLPISSSLPSECLEFCTLSQKDLNLLDNPISATVLSLALPVYCSLWGLRAPHEWRHVTYPLSDHGLGESYSACVVDRSIECSHPGTWRILVGDQSSSCLYQLPHRLFHDGVTQGVTRVRDRYSICLCREPCLRCLTHFSRRQELHRGLPTRNIPRRYHFLHGRCQRHLFRSLFVVLPQALNFLTLLFVAVFEQLSPS